MARRQSTFTQELRDREWIHKLWETHEECFTALDVWTEQRLIHDYYKAHRRDWTQEEIKLYWRNSDPALAESAHKSLLLLKGVVRWCEKTQGRKRQHYRLPPGPSSVVTEAGKKRIRVTPLARPELDYRSYARALIELAKELSQQSPPGKSGEQK